MWYSVSLLFVAEHPDEHDADPIWEQSIVLFQADDEMGAERLALELGKAQEIEYLNLAGQRVCWRFTQVERVCLIKEEALGSGTELFSRFLKNADVKSLLTPFGDEYSPKKS